MQLLRDNLTLWTTDVDANGLFPYFCLFFWSVIPYVIDISGSGLGDPKRYPLDGSNEEKIFEFLFLIGYLTQYCASDNALFYYFL